MGIPVGKFEFGSKTLTRPVTPGMKRPHSKNELLEATWQFRVNRLRGTWLENVPCPLPEHYVLGFDEQKIDTEGIPARFFQAIMSPDLAVRARMIAQEQEIPESPTEKKGAYPVYLNGELRRTGWWYYYLLTLVYKVPGRDLAPRHSFARLAQVREPLGLGVGRGDHALDRAPGYPFIDELVDRHQPGFALCPRNPAFSFHFRWQARPVDARAFRVTQMGDVDVDRGCARFDDCRVDLDLPELSGVLQLGLGRAGRKTRPVDRQQS